MTSLIWERKVLSDEMSLRLDRGWGRSVLWAFAQWSLGAVNLPLLLISSNSIVSAIKYIVRLTEDLADIDNCQCTCVDSGVVKWTRGDQARNDAWVGHALLNNPSIYLSARPFRWPGQTLKIC